MCIRDRAYLEAFEATKDEKYASIVEETFSYVIRDMLNEEGGFFSAEDADSEGEEGKFYTWTEKEIEEVLGSKLSKDFINVFSNIIFTVFAPTRWFFPISLIGSSIIVPITIICWIIILLPHT